MLSWQENLSTHFLSVQRRTCQTVKAVKTYYNVLPKMLCRTLHWAGFLIELHKNKLLEVKVTIEFQRQHCKNLISAQCINCSGHLVKTNFEFQPQNFQLWCQAQDTRNFSIFCAWDAENLVLWCVKISYFYDRKYQTFKILFSTLKIRWHRGL
jgi:hypothetical protein